MKKPVALPDSSHDLRYLLRDDAKRKRAPHPGRPLF
jgi:hypothetical protein